MTTEFMEANFDESDYSMEAYLDYYENALRMGFKPIEIITYREWSK